MKKDSQNKKIRVYLEAGGKLTAMAALNFWDCWNLKGRIYDIREEYRYEWYAQKPGNKKPMKEILTTFVKTKSGKTIAEYSLKCFD